MFIPGIVISVLFCSLLSSRLKLFLFIYDGNYRQIAVGCRDFLLFFCFEFFFLRSNMLPSFLVRVQDGAGMRLCSSGKKITMYLAVQMELAHHAYHVPWGSILCPTLLEFYICFKFSQIMDL